MSRLTILKIALLVVGLVVFGYGMRADDERIRLAGIGFFAAGFLLRLFPRERRPDDDSQ